MSMPAAIEAEPMQPHTHRRRAFGLAVFTSLLSKGGTLLLLVIAMPLAYQVLGKDRFGVFAALQSLMWLMALADLGIGAGLSRRLTLAVSQRDRSEQTRVMSTGFYLIGGIVCLGGIMGALLLLCVPVTTLYGQNFAPYAAELSLNLWLGGGVFMMMLGLGVLVKIREAHQEIHIVNSFGAVANVVSAVLLFFGIAAVPQVWYILLAIYGVQMILLGSNAVLALRERPWMIPRWRCYDRSLARSLGAEGLGFFVLVGVTPIFGRELIRWLLGQYFTPAVVGYFAILAQLGYAIFGIVVMLTYPLRPALVDAHARREYSWLRRVGQRLHRLWLLGALLVPVGFAVFGPWLVKVWFQQDIPLTSSELGWFGCFLMLTIWTEIHCVLLSGVGKIREAAWVAGLEAVALGLGAWLGVRMGGMSGALIGASGGMLITSFVLLPRLWKRSLALPSGHPQPPLPAGDS